MEKSIGFMINKTALKMKNNLNSKLKENGFNITAHQFAILNIVCENKGLVQSEIADILEQDKTGITRTLDSMEKNDLIKREKHETDRRAYCIFLTGNGEKVKNEAEVLIDKKNSVLIKNFGKKEYDEFMRLLDLLYETIE